MGSAIKFMTAALAGMLTIIGPTARAAPPLTPPAPRTYAFLDGQEFLLDQDFVWTIGSTTTSIVVPAGFVTDYASIPPALRGILAKQGRYSRAALLHDFLYWSQLCTRAQSDNLLMIAMKESGVRWRDREAVYRGVDLGGGSAWRQNARDRSARMLRVVPATRYHIADENTWMEARRILMADHEVDPPFTINPRACVIGNRRDVP